MTIRNQRAFGVGLLFVIVASGFLYFSTEYTLGTAARMGPGYFPRLVSLLLGAVGLAVMAGAVLSRGPVERLKRWNVRSLLWIVGSVTLFAILLYPLGFVISLVVLVVVSSKASPEFAWTGALINAAVLTALSVAIFVWGLGIQFPVWPTLWIE